MDKLYFVAYEEEEGLPGVPICECNTLEEIKRKIPSKYTEMRKYPPSSGKYIFVAQENSTRSFYQTYCYFVQKSK